MERAQRGIPFICSVCSCPLPARCFVIARHDIGDGIALVLAHDDITGVLTADNIVLRARSPQAACFLFLPSSVILATRCSGLCSHSVLGVPDVFGLSVSRLSASWLSVSPLPPLLPLPAGISVPPLPPVSAAPPGSFLSSVIASFLFTVVLAPDSLEKTSAAKTSGPARVGVKSGWGMRWMC